MFTPEIITKFSNTPTPFYHYDLNVLEQTLKALKSEANKYDYHVHYALKANSNNIILNAIKQFGLGADCVSGNEILKAVECGYNNTSIAFAGLGKSDQEINIGLDHNIFCFNCESLPEIEVINELAANKNKVANIALRINPNVNAKTHHYITTGLEENKFGINMWELENVIEALKSFNNIKLIGLHFHIGSQITDLSVFKGLCIRVNEIQDWFISRNIIVEHINVGGGLGVDYENPDENLIPDFKNYFGLFNQFLTLQPSQQLHFELGRAIVAQCGNLISKVLYIKNGVNTNFSIIDAGMTELLRPALYQATHKIENLSSSAPTQKYDVVGPVCESSDCFGKAIDLPETKRGDVIAIRTAGAYGEVMANRYNLRELNEVVFS
ncbi:diaminopimelate decarboxylase [Vicingus serpentipes]|uniref:Diaminopimelate decarboxylase n=1 Tax=Vicingus serpentipes TaxID=1926625 RepID=A0A5C6RY23_9FLAO|nr:diaminopimelate decarboxylase [Vicingus serpentipes]TXB67073.1 diaminopimelate decarboxylase [Vicingus serpentipes]